MAIPFARTLRSLDSDRFRVPRFVYLLAVILLAAWFWWFTSAQIPDPARAGSSITPAKIVLRSIGIGQTGYLSR